MDRVIFIIDPIIATLGIINPCVRLTSYLDNGNRDGENDRKSRHWGLEALNGGTVLIACLGMFSAECRCQQGSSRFRSGSFSVRRSLSGPSSRGLEPIEPHPERQLLSIVIGVAIGVRKFEKQAGSTRGNVTWKCQHHLSRNSASNWAFQDKLSNTISAIHS